MSTHHNEGENFLRFVKKSQLMYYYYKEPVPLWELINTGRSVVVLIQQEGKMVISCSNLKFVPHAVLCKDNDNSKKKQIAMEIELPSLEGFEDKNAAQK